MSRLRSEYLLTPVSDVLTMPDRAAPRAEVRPVDAADRESLAKVLLDAYRGTVDDEGEGGEEALAAIDEYFARMVWQDSVVLGEDDGLVAMSFVVVVDGRHYMDPVATVASRKRRGRGRAVVLSSLRSLAERGVQEVGAVITDGNTPSEHLFTGLGFVRVGSWG